ncbi:hypothetical protein [Nonomuraea sp. NPDC050202]|uniref:hypothetical protein n=1 Tax=Nonomuraea sp. NPDC050202 TaxID=3155035 RepID=UPI0033F2E295
MADLTWTEAWCMWFTNVQVNQHTLHGVSILALGRAGKVVAFAAGLIVVLDIIGPQGVKTVVRYLQGAVLIATVSFGFAAVAAIGVRIAVQTQSWLVLPLMWVAFLILGAFVKYEQSTRIGGRRFGALSRWTADRFVKVSRIWSLVMVGVGFHFDLLAS